MKKFLMIVALVAVVATITEAVDCGDYKKSDEKGPCTGCVFVSGDMEGKCKTAGQYSLSQSDCEAEAGGVWCGN